MVEGAAWILQCANALLVFSRIISSNRSHIVKLPLSRVSGLLLPSFVILFSHSELSVNFWDSGAHLVIHQDVASWGEKELPLDPFIPDFRATLPARCACLQFP